MRLTMWLGALMLNAAAVGRILAQDSARACPATYAEAEESDATMRSEAETRVRQAAAAHVGQTPPARLSVTYVATSREAAVDLAHWWAAQAKVGVNVREEAGNDAAQQALYAQIRAKLPPGATFTPATTACPSWTVHVEGAPGALAKTDVSAWFDRFARSRGIRAGRCEGLGSRNRRRTPDPRAGLLPNHRLQLTGRAGGSAADATRPPRGRCGSVES
jgi:hypothetical protein